MLRRFLLAALLCAPTLARADAGKGEIDWTRRVLIGHGQGAPDLNAASIAVARLGAERAAKVDALRNALETLKGATLESGSNVGTLLQNDNTMRMKIEGKLRGVQPIKTHYFSDGGVSLDIEVPLDQLPPDIAKELKPPPGVAAPGAEGHARDAEARGRDKDADKNRGHDGDRDRGHGKNGDKDRGHEKDGDSQKDGRDGKGATDSKPDDDHQ